MQKAFLSHSSKDKWYVDIVAEKLGKDNIVYDKLTFQEGNKTIDEVLKGVRTAAIFCFFISEGALASEWVQTELAEAEQRLASSTSIIIFPIIVDPNIKYSDPRIPEWLQKQYNLKYVAKPTKAAERIKQKFMELSWNLHPKNKRLSQLFIGRIELRKSFEARIYDYEKPFPTVISVSGFPSIGRRKFITQALKNADKINEHSTPISILLENRSSIEDFILALYDLGLSAMNRDRLSNLMLKDLNSKIEIAYELVVEIRQHEDVIYVIDTYSIIVQDGTIVGWFDELLRKFDDNKLMLVLISRVRLKHHLYRFDEAIFPIDVYELDPNERKALFAALLDIQKVFLSTDDFNTITNLFNGYPEQVRFAFNLLVKEGRDYVLNNPNQILDYNSDKVFLILRDFKGFPSAVLRLICEFDFISKNFLLEILSSEDPVQVKEVIDELANNFIIEFIGADKEYIRANDVVRDFVFRNGSGIKAAYKEKIQSYAREVISGYETEDLSSYTISIKEVLKSGGAVPEHLLIPSHFLNAMRELYDVHNKYDDVITLAERVLFNERFLDSRIVGEVRYWLCLALARKRDKRILTEVRKIEGPNHNYLLGFYYRLSGNYDAAIDRLQQVLSDHNSMKAKRELVFVYLSLEDYHNAIGYAKEVYEKRRTNPFNLQSYFRCLIKLYGKSRKDELMDLLNNFKKINNAVAKEMEMISQAQYYTYAESNFVKALDIVNEAILQYPDTFYPLLTKLEVCKKFEAWDELERAVEELERNYKNDPEAFEKISYLTAKTALMAHKGLRSEAIRFAETKVRYKFPDSVYNRFISELKSVNDRW